jgi:hypothetical protein
VLSSTLLSHDRILYNIFFKLQRYAHSSNDNPATCGRLQSLQRTTE